MRPVACSLTPRSAVERKRGGASAADFYDPYEGMLKVAQNTPFDRLYFYADQRPIHVSVGPENKRQIVWMRRGKAGWLVPRVVGIDSFLRLSSDGL